MCWWAVQTETQQRVESYLGPGGLWGREASKGSWSSGWGWELLWPGEPSAPPLPLG